MSMSWEHRSTWTTALVLTHARALLTSAPACRTAYIHPDLRDPAAILSHPDTRAVLDSGKPIALASTTTAGSAAWPPRADSADRRQRGCLLGG